MTPKLAADSGYEHITCIPPNLRSDRRFRDMADLVPVRASLVSRGDAGGTEAPVHSRIGLVPHHIERLHGWHLHCRTVSGGEHVFLSRPNRRHEPVDGNRLKQGDSYVQRMGNRVLRCIAQ